MNAIKILIGAAIMSGILSASSIAAEAQKKAEKLRPYTLKTCLVSDEKLGSMGKPYVHEYKGQEIKLCCKGCVKDFNKEPAKYMKKLQAEEAKAKKTGGSTNDHTGHQH